MASVYVKIPEPIGPLDRGRKYEDPLEEALRAQGAGRVTGGGQQLGVAPSGDRYVILHCGVDVDLKEVPGGLGMLRRELQRIGAPPGTELQYKVDGRDLKDVLSAEGWQSDQPRTTKDPGRGA
jgi:hypothetical protein